MSEISNWWALAIFIMLVNIYLALRGIRNELRKQGKK